MMPTGQTLPPTNAYYAYGAASPPNGKAPIGNFKSDMFLEEGDAALGLKLSKPRKAGFLGFGLTDNLAMLVTFLLPCLIFAAVYALVAFYFHYKYAALAWFLVVIVAVAVVGIGYFAVMRMLRPSDGYTDHLAVWAAALLAGTILAFALGLWCGLRSYARHMQPIYEWQELNKYSDVDPSKMEGRAYMDAGVLNFKAGTHVNTTLATGFMNLDMYCVAPIVSAGAAPTSYDFWAVGRDCCTGASNSFSCGDVEALKTGQTTSGLRLLSDSELAFYKLAVTQAATKYNIKSAHPIFVHMVQDAAKAMVDHGKAGWASYWPAWGFFAIFEAILVGLAAVSAMIVKSKYA